MSENLKSLVLADLCRFDKEKYNKHDLFLQDLRSDERYSSGEVVKSLRQYANFGLVIDSKYDDVNGSLTGMPVDFLIFKKDSRIYFPSNGSFSKDDSHAVKFLSNNKLVNLVDAVKDYFNTSLNDGLVIIGSKKRDLSIDNAYLIADYESKRKVVSAAMSNGFVNRQQDVGGIRHMLNGAYDYVRSHNHQNV